MSTYLEQSASYPDHLCLYSAEGRASTPADQPYRTSLTFSFSFLILARTHREASTIADQWLLDKQYQVTVLKIEQGEPISLVSRKTIEALAFDLLAVEAGPIP